MMDMLAIAIYCYIFIAREIIEQFTELQVFIFSRALAKIETHISVSNWEIKRSNGF
jgi:hypothetical protein